MPISCEIVLENYDEQIRAGCVIKGHIACTFRNVDADHDPPSELILKYVVTRKEHTRMNGHNNVLKSDVGKTERRIFNIDRTMITRRTEMNFPFNYYIPDNTPSSFTSQFGTISYLLKVDVEMDSRPTIHEEKSIKIISILSANQFPSEFLEPDHFFTQSCCKTSLWTCLTCQRLSMKVMIRKRVYTPGERVPLAVIISNYYPYKKFSISIKIVQLIGFKRRCNILEKVLKKNLLELKEDRGFIVRNEAVTCNFSLDIPDDVDILNFDGCALFRIRYLLIVKARINRKNLTIKQRLYLASPIPEPATLSAVTSSTTLVDGANIQIQAASSLPNAPPPLPEDDLDSSVYPLLSILNAPRLVPGTPQTQTIPESPPPSYDEVIENPPKYR